MAAPAAPSWPEADTASCPARFILERQVQPGAVRDNLPVLNFEVQFPYLGNSQFLQTLAGNLYGGGIESPTTLTGLVLSVLRYGWNGVRLEAATFGHVIGSCGPASSLQLPQHGTEGTFSLLPHRNVARCAFSHHRLVPSKLMLFIDSLAAARAQECRVAKRVWTMMQASAI